MKKMEIDFEPEHIENSWGNKLLAQNAMDYMAQADQIIMDTVWETVDNNQDAFDLFCKMWLEENGEEFYLDTPNPQW